MPSSPAEIDLDAIARRIQGALLRLRVDAPFFAALTFFARFIPVSDVATACTDGRDVFYNPAFVASLPGRMLDAALLHEVLHAALLHVPRRGKRDPLRWGIAADIVVNGIVRAQPGLVVAEDWVIDPKLEHLDVEEIYELLASRVIEVELHCLRGRPELDRGEHEQLDAYWQLAVQHARVLGGAGAAPGKQSAALDRLFGAHAPRLDWRTELYRFLARTPTDFGDFDRRFVHRGLYLEGLDGTSLTASIAVDTSGSIEGEMLTRFMAEVRGVLGAYPHIHAELYYADAALYGPYDVAVDRPLPAAKGGGGTLFAPFFDRIARTADSAERVLIYLTDGYGLFPTIPPSAPVLWVVPPGGARDGAFPFGTVVRMIDDDARG